MHVHQLRQPVGRERSRRAELHAVRAEEFVVVVALDVDDAVKRAGANTRRQSQPWAVGHGSYDHGDPATLERIELVVEREAGCIVVRAWRDGGWFALRLRRRRPALGKTSERQKQQSESKDQMLHWLPPSGAWRNPGRRPARMVRHGVDHQRACHRVLASTTSPCARKVPITTVTRFPGFTI